MSRPAVLLALLTSTPAFAVDWSAWHVAGDDCPLIPAGTTVVVDQDIDVSHLQIEGTLQWSGGSWDLTAEQIDVRSGGSLELGTAIAPYTDDVQIMLVEDAAVTCPAATADDRELRVHGGGNIEIHGDYLDAGGARRIAWTRLEDTAAVGDLSVVLQSGVDWAVGDEFVIASTDFDLDQVEIRTVDSLSTTNVANDTVHFTTALTYEHVGQDFGFGPASVSERAEVGLLSRNVQLTGTVGSDVVGNPKGGQLKLMAGGGTPPAVALDWVEVYDLGATNNLGIYPVHFHGADDQTGSYVRGLALHDNHFRALTIHNTSNLEVTGNVAVESFGHLYYLEAGTETGNQLVDNLGLGARAVDIDAADCATHFPLLACEPSDATPGVFYVRHLDNELQGNAAAGSEGHGFYLSPGDGHTTPPTLFDDNTAHSNEIHGLFQNDAVSPSALAEYTDFVGYKNRQYGVWLRSWEEAELSRFRLADNRAGAYLASGGWQAKYSLITLKNSLIIGETTNAGVAATADEICAGRSLPLGVLSDPLTGFDVYDGRTVADTVAFANFRTLDYDCDGDGFIDTTRYAGAFHQTHKENRWAVDPRNAATGILFHSSANEVYFRDPFDVDSDGASGVASVVLVDADGSITGTAGDRVVVDNPLIVPAGATWVADWNAYQVSGTHNWGQVEITDRDRHHRRMWIEADHDPGTLVKVLVPAKNSSSRYPFNVLAEPSTLYSYDVTWPAGTVPHDLLVKLRLAAPGAQVMLQLPYASSAPSSITDGTGAAIIAADCVTAGGCVGIDLETAAGSAWFHDGVDTLTVKLVAPIGGSITDFVIEELVSITP